MFDEFSKKFNIPWEVYPALIRIETNFNPTLMSKAGAKGISQVMVATAKEECSKLNIQFTDATLWNEILNLTIGLSYFSEGYKECVGDLDQQRALVHAIKRYCGGPGYSKGTDSSKAYVGEYKTTVWEEYTRLSYVFKGVLYSRNTEPKETQKSYAMMAKPSLWLWSLLSKKVSIVPEASAAVPEKNPLILGDKTSIMIKETLSNN
jgi:soluble lytic murein transglycosylase-like protein